MKMTYFPLRQCACWETEIKPLKTDEQNWVGASMLQLLFPLCILTMELGAGVGEHYLSFFWEKDGYMVSYRHGPQSRVPTPCSIFIITWGSWCVCVYTHAYMCVSIDFTLLEMLNKFFSESVLLIRTLVDFHGRTIWKVLSSCCLFTWGPRARTREKGMKQKASSVGVL